MKVNCLSITFWFNIIDNENEVLKSLQEEFDDYNKYELFNKTDNLMQPIITGVNNQEKTNLVVSQINLQYNMDNTSLKDEKKFKEKALKLYNILIKNNVKVLHTALFVNSEITIDNPLKSLEKIINSSFNTSELVDISIKLSKCHEELFYKIVSLFNKKQVKMPKEVDDKGRFIPLPLISFNGSFVENEMIDISYEINDKYLYDFTKNYSTTEFYLNKMLYLLFSDIESDINNILEKGKF